MIVERSQRVNPSVRVLRMNRPDKRNALNGELVAALTAELRDADGDPTVRVVVLEGAGRAFSAGADLQSLQDMQEASQSENLRDSRRLRALFETIRLLSKPVIAAVRGHAIAGGCGLAVACDIAVVARGARMGFTEVRIGFVPALVSVYLRDRVTEQVMRDLLLTGRLVDADEAVRLGLAARAVDPDEFDREIDDMVTLLARECSPEGVGSTKRLLSQLPGLAVDDALDHAARVNAAARAGSDCKAGIRSFLEKRPFPWQEAWDDAS